MAAYLLADIDVREPVRYEEYKRKVPELIARHGGEYLVRGGEAEVVEGDFEPRRLVLLRFPSRQALHDFLEDPDYRPLLAIRHETADSNVIVVEGVRA